MGSFIVMPNFWSNSSLRLGANSCVSNATLADAVISRRGKMLVAKIEEDPALYYEASKQHNRNNAYWGLR